MNTRVCVRRGEFSAEDRQWAFLAVRMLEGESVSPEDHRRVTDGLLDMNLNLRNLRGLSVGEIAELRAKHRAAMKVLGEICKKRNFLDDLKFLLFTAVAMIPVALLGWLGSESPEALVVLLVVVVVSVCVYVFRKKVRAMLAWLLRSPLYLIRSVRRMFRRIEELTRPE